MNAPLRRELASEQIFGLVRGLAEPMRSNRLLLMLKAYIDDSRMGQPPIYVLGGWVAQAKVWAPFSDAWADILRMSPRIGYFKFAEAMNFTGEFAGISKPLRDEKLRLLVGAVAEYSLLGISVSIPHRIFYPLFGRHPNPDIRNPYVLAFYALISRLLMHYGPDDPQDKIEFVFDYQPTSNSMAVVQAGWQTFLNTAPAPWQQRLTNHPPSFLDDKEIIALQAADLHAGWVRTMNEAAFLGQEIPKPVWGDRGDAIPRLYRYVTEEAAEQLFQEMFGYKPVRFNYRWSDVWRVSVGG